MNLRTLLNLSALLLLTFSTATGQSLWSDPASWPSGTVPQAGDNVVIPAGTHIVLDGHTPQLTGLTVRGRLSFTPAEVSITTHYLLVEGLLEAGSLVTPYTGHLTITVNGPDEDPMGMGSRLFGTANGGSFELHGQSARKRSWTKLDGHAFRGATSFTLVDEPTEWQVGDHIAVAPSGYKAREAEEVTITAINGRTVTFTPALVYNHWGEVQTYHGQTLDERAEVAILTRNIVVQGPESSEADGFGAHGMVMPGSGPIHVEGVQFRRMGQPGREARYSFHWHLAGDRFGDYIRNCTVRDALQRGYVVHGSSNVLVKDNVAFRVKNHAYIPAEDGDEMGNRFEGNIAIWVQQVERGKMAFPHGTHPETMSNQSEHRAAGFWLRNIHNPLINNVAAGVERGVGFFYDQHGRHRDQRDFDLLDQPIIFQDNVAHSIEVPGRSGNAGTNVALYGAVGHGFGLFVDNFYIGDDDVQYRFDNFVAYKCDMAGIWNEETNVVFSDMLLADNAIAYVTGEAFVENSLVIGQSADTIGGRNRSLRHGHERAGYYTVSQGGKKRPRFDGVTFVNMDEGASDIHLTGSFIIDYHLDMKDNYARNLTFDNAVAANFETTGAVGNTPGGAMLYDADGSISGTGQPQLLTFSNSPLRRPDCAIDYQLRAHVCPADAYMNIDIPRVDRVRFRFYLDQESTGTRVHDGGLNTRLSRMRSGETVTLVWDHIEDVVPDEYGIAFHTVGAAATGTGLLRIPYPYPGVTMVNHNGDIIPRVDSEATVEQVDFPAFYFDEAAGMILLRGVATGQGDEDGKDWVYLAPGDQEIETGLDLGGGATSLENPSIVEQLSVFPNPVTESSIVRLGLLEATEVELSIVDLLGRTVEVLQHTRLVAGNHELPLRPTALPAGVYQLRVQVGNRAATTGLVIR